jgi:hypothetical protein
MKKVAVTKFVWCVAASRQSPDDLQEHLAEAVNAFKADRDWQQVLAILIRGSEMSDSDQPETTCPLASEPRSDPAGGVQIAREYLMTMLPRRRLSGGNEGKTITPTKSIPRQISDIPKTPVVQGTSRCRISRGAPGSLPGLIAGHRRRKGQNAGDPIDGDPAPSPSSYHTYLRRWQSSQ